MSFKGLAVFQINTEGNSNTSSLFLLVLSNVFAVFSQLVCNYVSVFIVMNIIIVMHS